MPFLHEQRREDDGAADGIVDEGGLADGAQEGVGKVGREPLDGHRLVGQVVVDDAAVAEERVPRVLRGILSIKLSQLKHLENKIRIPWSSSTSADATCRKKGYVATGCY